MVFDSLFGPPQRRRRAFTERDKNLLYTEQKGRCNGCGKKFEARNMAIDRVRPHSKGGSDLHRNLQLLCHSCNSIKGDGTMAQLKKRLAEKGISQAPAKSKAAPTKKSGSKAAAKKPKRRTRNADPLAEFFRW